LFAVAFISLWQDELKKQAAVLVVMLERINIAYYLL
jgi:hypothetical protein